MYICKCVTLRFNVILLQKMKTHKKQLFLAIFFIFICRQNFIFASTNKQIIDSICVANKYENDSIKFLKLRNYAMEYLEPDKKLCLSLNIEILQFCKIKKLFFQEIITLNTIASLSKNFDKLSDAIRYYLMALEKCNSYHLPLENKAATFIDLSILFYDYKMVELSKEYAQLSYDIIKNIVLKTDYEITAHVDMIRLMQDLELYHNSIVLLNILENRLMKTDRLRNEFLICKLFKSKYYHFLKKTEDRNKEIKSIEILLKDTLTFKEGIRLFVTNTFASFDADDTNYMQAIKSLHSQFIMCKKAKEGQKWYAILHRDLAINYLNIKKIDLAKYHANKYYEISLKEDFRLDVAKGLELLANIYSLTDEKEIAFEYLQRLKNINDSITELHQSDFIFKLVNKYYIESKDLQNKILRNEKHKNEIELARKDNKLKYLIILFIIFTVLGLLILYLFWKNKLNLNILKHQSHAISEKGKLLEIQNEKLLLLNDEINNLTNAVSHDLKSPLSRIEGLLNIISMDAQLSKDNINYIGIAQNEISSAKEMIANILLNAEDNSNSKRENEVFNLSEAICSLLFLFDIEAEKKKITIQKNIQSTILFKGNKLNIERIFSNIISNAIKFSNTNTTIHVSLHDFDNSFVFRVKDQGPGISEEDQKKLFQKFSKLSNKPTGNENSTGLGLYITKQLIDKMGGSIKVNSTLKIGTTFEITLQKN